MDNMKKIEALELELDTLKRHLKISTLKENKLLKEIDAFKADVEMKTEIIAQIAPGNKRNCLTNLNTRILAENEELKKQLREKEDQIQNLMKELEVALEVKDIISREKESDYKSYLDKLRYLNEKIEVLTEKNNNLLKIKKDQPDNIIQNIGGVMKDHNAEGNIPTHKNNMVTSSKNSPLSKMSDRNNISVYLESGTSSGWLNKSDFSRHFTPDSYAYYENDSQVSCSSMGRSTSMSMRTSDFDENKVCRLQHAIKLKEEVINYNTDELTKLKEELNRVQNSEMSNSYISSSEEIIFSNTEGISEKSLEECSSASSNECDVKDQNCECNLSKMSLEF